MDKIATTPTQRFLKVADLAVELRCSLAKAYRLIENGEVRSVKVGGLLRIPREELNRLAGVETETR